MNRLIPFQATRIAIVAAIAMGLTGCSAHWTDMGGSIGEQDFTHPLTVFHGGSLVLIVDRAMDCRDLGWVQRRYLPGQSPSATDFVALLIDAPDDLSADVPTAPVGYRSVQVTGLVNLGGSFDLEYGRSGTFTIDKIEDDVVTGGISVSFAHSGVGGEFTSEFCQSLTNVN